MQTFALVFEFLNISLQTENRIHERNSPMLSLTLCWFFFFADHLLLLSVAICTRAWYIRDYLFSTNDARNRVMLLIFTTSLTRSQISRSTVKSDIKLEAHDLPHIQKPGENLVLPVRPNRRPPVFLCKYTRWTMAQHTHVTFTRNTLPCIGWINVSCELQHQTTIPIHKDSRQQTSQSVHSPSGLRMPCVASCS